MDAVRNWPFPVFIALFWSLTPVLAVGFAGSRIIRSVERLPVAMRLLLPCLCGVPYLLVALSAGTFRWEWCALYFALPALIALLLWRTRLKDTRQKGTWLDAIILLCLGLAVDLRRFEAAWPHSLTFIGKLVLVDCGLYGFMVIRQLGDVGFDLRIRWRDLLVGLRETVFFAPIASGLGLALGFLEWHGKLPSLGEIGFAWMFTFLFIAIPEELYFRGWVQNLLERRVGRRPALFLTAIIFGMAHFNKRARFFNWRYVLLAALAGIFYGRAWRQEHRLAASSITHATTDTVWSIWFRH
ncbi:MAG TPA: CPBP family intramembrane glutamic endopeptidase [Candidatus Angelobacter sp.]|jgi:hypothetical protein|nr:CPBP family intramembrane glutamic endopeptidase [Candidatus Angelobacter sp.]